MKIALLISGQLGHLVFKKIFSLENIVAVFTDNNSKEIIAKCEEYGISYFVGNPRKGKASQFIFGKKIEIILSVNYLFLIEQDLIEWPTKLALNVHGSLLPRYRGRTPHVWAIINNEQQTGITVHVIEESCDTGDILAQERIAIADDDTGNDLLLKYQEVYPIIIEKVFQDIKLDRLHRVKQDDSKATFFGKRVPEDGKINWNWQKERIRNWVRALAHPYPGAFSIHNGKKIIIDKVEFSNAGFDYSFPNGMIINAENEIIVKSPNGAIKLSQFRDSNKCFFKKGEILK
ncbi:methionyl-tRNA formyltransferase [Reichenbachiella sp. MALMAid0571]|uniref:methionyl-tRNA formyltransferase n=1 Tax=Reichenbachiella sp. MALMAid0571 TaxID=3143939 RepID=UPI0032DF8E22